MVAHDIVSEQKENVCLRVVADTLTLFRLAVAAFIITIGLFVGPQALNAAIVAVFAGEVSDAFDGFFARMSGTRPTWVSRVDPPADLVLVYSFFLFLVITGLFPLYGALVFAGLSLGVVIWKPTTAVVDMVTAPVFALPIVLSFHAGLIMGLTYCGFVLIMLMVKWDRIMSDAKRARFEAKGLPTED